MPTDVVALVADGSTAFELGVVCEAFGVDRSEQGLPVMDFAVCAATPAVRSASGFGIAVDDGLDRVASADLVCVPAVQHSVGDTVGVPDAMLEAIAAAAARGATVLSLCSGAFVLGDAGLLDGRECTTHWVYTELLARRFPTATVVPEVLYVEDGPIVTSAGTAAGIDACLHLWRRDHGAAAAASVARRMVVPPQRAGGQAQFIRTPVPECDAETLGPLLTWLTQHLDQPHTVESLASRSAMSPRTFARRFRDETGTTPHAWLTTQRVLRAEELLETTDRPVDRIASDVGFAAAAALRHHFTRTRGLSPQQYRRQFSCTPD